jgi:hypothetical protein
MVCSSMQREADAAHVEAFQLLRFVAAADDELGRPATDVHHHALLGGGRQAVRHAQIDEPRLLLARHHFDRKPERAFGPRQEVLGVLRHAQRVGADGAYLRRIEATQALAETMQGVERALLGLLVEPFVGAQARGESHRLAQGIERIDLVVHNPAHLEAEAVRAQIDGGHHRLLGG